MELAYEGSITEKNFSSAHFKLKTRLFFYEGKNALNLYWNSEESAPVAEIDGRKIKKSQVDRLAEICLSKNFMVKRI